MAHLKSSKKRERRTKRRTEINNQWRKKIQELRKKFRRLDDGKEIEESPADLMETAQKTLDKAAQKGIIHKNRAARLKSRWSNKLGQLT